MSQRRVSAAAIVLSLGALSTGCGLGPGKGLGDVRLTVTHDFGSQPVFERAVGGVTESDTVMRVLERSTKLATSYGGGFVQSIDGVEGGTRGAQSYDWFYYVNGIESPIGAAAYALAGGEAIWWDYRDWSAAMEVPAVVGSWPEPFSGGYEGHHHPVAIECLGGGSACGKVRAELVGAGASVVGGLPAAAIRVLVGPWGRVRADPAAAEIDAGPQVSGVFAEFGREGNRYRLRGLAEDGDPQRSFGAAAGLIAATRRGEAPPTWVITGTDSSGTDSAAALLNGADLRDHYAVATEGAKETPLPLR